MKKKPDKTEDKILKPGMGVDITFNLDSIKPMFRSSIVFECDYSNHTLIVAQPSPIINKDIKYDKMHITTLVNDENSNVQRIGYACDIIEGINKYELANNNSTPALKISYIPEKLELNIRNAYRFYPTQKYDVMGKILYNGVEFYSGTHFRIYNISISGIGISIPPKTMGKIKNEINPLRSIKSGDTAKIGLLLKRGKSKESIIAIDGVIRIVRATGGDSKSSGFAGVTFVKLNSQHEDVLNRFIHDAQMYEIRSINKLYSENEAT